MPWDWCCLSRTGRAHLSSCITLSPSPKVCTVFHSYRSYFKVIGRDGIRSSPLFIMNVNAANPMEFEQGSHFSHSLKWCYLGLIDIKVSAFSLSINKIPREGRGSHFVHSRILLWSDPTSTSPPSPVPTWCWQAIIITTEATLLCPQFPPLKRRPKIPLPIDYVRKTFFRLSIL